MANGIGVQGAQAYGSPWLASAYRTPSGAWAGGVPPGYTPLTSGWAPEAAGMGPTPGGVGGSGGQPLVLASNMDFPVGAVSAADPLRRMFSPPAGMVPNVDPETMQILNPESVMFESLAGEPGVNLLPSWVGPATAGLDIANIAMSDRPDAAKGMLAAQAILPAFGIPSPFLPVQAIDFVSRLFGGGGLFAGNRPHAYVPPYDLLSPAERARIDEASTVNTLQPFAESTGLSVPTLRSLASANTALSLAEIAQVVQGMPAQDVLNPATMVQRVQEATPTVAAAPAPYWAQDTEFSGEWRPGPEPPRGNYDQLFQFGGMVPWVPGRPRSGDVVKSWLEPGEVVVPRELAPAVLQQFPHLAMTPRRQFFQGGGMVPWRGGMESPVWAPGGGLRFEDGGRVPEEVYPEDGTLDLPAADRMFRRNPGLAKTHEYVPEAGKIVRKDYLPAFREQLKADRAYERQGQRLREQHRSGGGLRFQEGGRVPGRVATLAADVLREYGIRPIVGAGALTMNARRN